MTTNKKPTSTPTLPANVPTTPVAAPMPIEPPFTHSEQLRLMARILASLCNDSDPLVPYRIRGIDLRMCRYCRAYGRMEYGALLPPEHVEDCAMVLAVQLKAMMEG